MKLRFVFVTITTLIAIISVAQTNSSPNADDHAVLGLELAWNQAEIHRDVRAVDSFLGPDFLRVDNRGRLMNKAAYLAQVAAPNLEPSQIFNEEMKIQRYGDTAIIVSTYREAGMENGKRTSIRGRFTDVWVRREGKWMCVASQETLIR